MAWIARDGSLISDRGAPGRVRFLTDVKNVTRMQSKLCQPVRFIISLLRVSTQGISLSREKFNSQSETTKFTLMLTKFTLRRSFPFFSLSLSLFNIRSREGTPAVGSLKMINLTEETSREPIVTSSMKNERSSAFTMAKGVVNSS